MQANCLNNIYANTRPLLTRTVMVYSCTGTICCHFFKAVHNSQQAGIGFLVRKELVSTQEDLHVIQCVILVK